MKTCRNRCGFTLIDLLMVIAVLTVLYLLFFPRVISCRGKAPRITCTNNLKQVGLAFRIWAGDHQDTNPMQISVTNGGAMEAVLSGNIVAVFQVMSNELSTPKILFCPTDKKRIQAVVFPSPNAAKQSSGPAAFTGNTNLSYFVGLDAKDTLPSMFLSGDDNLLVGGNSGGYGGKPVTPGIFTATTNTPIAWADTRHEKQGNVGLADGSVQGFSSRALFNALANTGVETNRLVMP